MRKLEINFYTKVIKINLIPSLIDIHHRLSFLIKVQKQPIMIVMELVSGGSLLGFLRNNGTSLTSKNLLGKKFIQMF